MNVSDVYDVWSDLLVGRPVLAASGLVHLRSLVEGLDSETILVTRSGDMTFPFRSVSTGEVFRYVYLPHHAPLEAFTFNSQRVLSGWSPAVDASCVRILSNSKEDIRRWFRGDRLRLLVDSGRVVVAQARPSSNGDFPFEDSSSNLWTYCYFDSELSEYLTAGGVSEPAVTVSDIGSQLDSSLFGGGGSRGGSAGLVSYRTLSRWLACGSGELAEEPLDGAVVRTHLDYTSSQRDCPVPDSFRIRRFCSDEWLKPLDGNL